MSNLSPVRVRFAPSPTGRTHLGSGRTALYNYLFARQTGGQFILRIEDTDQKRFVPGAEQELIDSLHWLGIDWDEGPDVGGPHAPYHQSERKEIYQQYASQLLESGHAYRCFCTPERLAAMREEQKRLGQQPHYDRTCRSIDSTQATERVAAGEKHVIRFKIPEEGSITVHDLLRGPITIENRTLDDYVLVKSDGLALYHLAAMVDDRLMGITHVIRGLEWLSTFPLHGHIINAFGWESPVFVHLSVFLKPSGKGKMSKRESAGAIQDGHSIFVSDLKALGYIPEGVDNWIALMGWSFDDRTEVFTKDDLIEKFSLDKLNPAPAYINYTKLDHFNGVHIRSLSIPDLASRVKPFLEAAGYIVNDEKLLQIIPLIQVRLVTLDDAVDFAGFFFKDDIDPPVEALIGMNMSAVQSAEVACGAASLLAGMDTFDHETADAPLRRVAEEMGLSAGQFFGVLRMAVTGQKVSPPLLESMEIIGKETVLKRLYRAAEKLLK
jgi:glutamyl-tRNA synthetase